MGSAVELLRRYLDQRRELGERELVLGELTAADLEALLRRSGGEVAPARPEVGARAAPSTPAPQRERQPAPDRRSEPMTPREIMTGAPAVSYTHLTLPTN